MGKSGSKIRKTDKQIAADIDDVNKITLSKFFEQRVGLLIEFWYNADIKRIIGKMVIIKK